MQTDWKAGYNMSSLLERAKALNGHIEGLRKQIHQTPEIGMHLPKTQSLAMEELRDLGLTPRACGDSGVVALIEGARPGRTILLRADMDALPVAEETGLPFASKNGCMHADMTAMWLCCWALLAC